MKLAWTLLGLVLLSGCQGLRLQPLMIPVHRPSRRRLFRLMSSRS